MDIWQKARTFVEEAARWSRELTKEAAKRSSELTADSSKFSDILSESSKRSKKIAAEASKRAYQIKSLAENIAPPGVLASQQQQEEDLGRFGITEELREFVKELTINTFQDFPLEGTLLDLLIFSLLFEFTYFFNVLIIAFVLLLGEQ